VRKALAAGPPRGSGSLQDIKHVVILMQENRSVDPYFGTLPGALPSETWPFPVRACSSAGPHPDRDRAAQPGPAACAGGPAAGGQLPGLPTGAAGHEVSARIRCFWPADRRG
jgi:Phosphoesterase family